MFNLGYTRLHHQIETTSEESPSVKAYIKQFDSVILKEGVIYRRLEPLSDQVKPVQLLLPKTLRHEFLSLVHEGIAGHLGTYKT